MEAEQEGYYYDEWANIVPSFVAAAVCSMTVKRLTAPPGVKTISPIHIAGTYWTCMAGRRSEARTISVMNTKATMDWSMAGDFLTGTLTSGKTL